MKKANIRCVLVLLVVSLLCGCKENQDIDITKTSTPIETELTSLGDKQCYTTDNGEEIADSTYETTKTTQETIGKSDEETQDSVSEQTSENKEIESSSNEEIPEESKNSENNSGAGLQTPWG